MIRRSAVAEPAYGKITPRLATGAILVMFFWALCFPLLEVGLQSAPPMWFAAIRATLSGLVLLLIATLARRPRVRGYGTWTGIALVGFTATSIGFFGMFSGAVPVSPGLATAIANTQPLIAAVIAGVTLQERLTAVQWSGLMMGFIGIVVMGTSNSSESSTQFSGVLFILFGALGIAISNVLLKRMAGRVDILRAMGWQLLIGAIPLALLAQLTEDVTAIDWNLSFVLVLLGVSVLGTSAAFALWFALLQRASLGQLNAFTFLTPIFGLAMGVVFFDESLGFVVFTGIAISLFGIYLVSRRVSGKTSSASVDESEPQDGK